MEEHVACWPQTPAAGRDSAADTVITVPRKGNREGLRKIGPDGLSIFFFFDKWWGTEPNTVTELLDTESRGVFGKLILWWGMGQLSIQIKLKALEFIQIRN